MLSLLEIGNKVDICDLRQTKEETRKVYFSQVVDIKNSTQLSITVPTLGTKQIALEKGQRYRCDYYTSKGLLSGEFVVLDRLKEGNLPIIVLEIRTPLKKIQRREFYRYDCTLPIKCRIADENEKIPREELKNLEWMDGVALDLSGGGIRFVLPQRIEKNSYAQCKLVLEIREEYREFYIYGEIVNCRVVPNNVRLHECRMQFAKLTEAEQDEIISYIFTEERKKRNVYGKKDMGGAQ